VTTNALVLQRYGVAQTLALESAILDVYAASHQEPIESDPWFAPSQFWQRLVNIYSLTRDFETVGGWIQNELVGYAFGSPREDAASVFDRIRAALPDLPLPPDPKPIYIFREFAVSPNHQRRGYGRLIHDELLRPRHEPLAHLLVRVDNVAARAAYFSWGWKKIGQVKPFPDSPTMDSLVLPLPLQQP
jgi:ribosomal protein S18 acetylase RimI-like enzyme